MTSSGSIRGSAGVRGRCLARLVWRQWARARLRCSLRSSRRTSSRPSSSQRRVYFAGAALLALSRVDPGALESGIRAAQQINEQPAHN